MKYIIFLFLFSVSAQSKEIHMLTDISTLKWENRVIIVNTLDDKDRILEIFKQHKLDVIDRDIVWFINQEGMLTTNFNGKISEDLLDNINKKYNVKQNEVMLIGKDGGIKSRYTIVDLAAIFREVDAMPMRQVEIQSQ